MGQRAVMSESTTDYRLIESCRAGDPDAFESLFETYKDRVFSIALYSFDGDEAAASDVSQQIFLKLFTSIGQFRGDSAFTTWLYRMVVNACMDERRRRRRFIPFGEVVSMSSHADRQSQERQFAQVEVAESVKFAISKLRPKLRLPILLKYIEGLSYEEIARVLGCSKGTVASRLNRGHKELARRLAHLKDQVICGE